MTLKTEPNPRVHVTHVFRLLVPVPYSLFPSPMQHQQQLFDGYLRLKQCRRCRRRLQVDPNNRYRTREAGLCFHCLRAFERSPFWTVERFIERNDQ